VIRSPAGDVERIVEHKDATDEERRILEINTGIYCFVIADLAQVIDQLSAENLKGVLPHRLRRFVEEAEQTGGRGRLRGPFGGERNQQP
jgi:bifunctional N-acetylglucosamine-1-phosphate-uridyltransferase/glucosamine-1-phosphate-acetyltransferase GlmU-like protein